MTRFDADAPAERQKLFADAVLAHRERASAFLTVEAERPGAGGEDDSQPVEGGANDSPDGDEPPPWIQFADGVLNLDCTEDELLRLKELLGEFPAFKIEELNRPEEAEGVNARVSAKADARRIGQFVDEAFRAVYGLGEDYRAWVVEV